jgi:hypothetical protein
MKDRGYRGLYLETKVLDIVGNTGLILGLEASTSVDDQGDGSGGRAFVKGSNLDAVASLGDGGGVAGLKDGRNQVQGLAGRGDGQHCALYQLTREEAGEEIVQKKRVYVHV